MKKVLKDNKTQATYTAVVHQENDWFVSECIEIGTVSQGKTIEEAIENLIEATELYLEEMPMDKFIQKTRPLITTFELRHA